MRSIMDNISQPLQETVGSLTSSFSKKERYQRSFFLTAVRLFNCYITTVCSTFYYYSIPALYYLFHIYFYCCCFFSYLFFCGSGAAVLSEFPRCWINKVYQIKWKTHQGHSMKPSWRSNKDTDGTSCADCILKWFMSFESQESQLSKDMTCLQWNTKWVKRKNAVFNLLQNALLA